ncbi:MAG: tandem-95 repeat protein, partial [Acidobacteria bacterium]|nr:tandem-95 repeat protein [Acidobacteriota bacterium]
MRKKLLWVTILLAASFALTQSLAFVSTGASNGNAPAQPPASTPLAILTSFHRMMHAPALLVPLSGTTYTVNTVADNLDNNSPTPGSLRAAIRAANLNPGADTIEFAISGAGPHTINIGGGLPVITDALTIDGYSQPGASENTLVTGNNAVLQIELKDQTLSQGTALTIGASDCVVQGLVIHGFNVAVSLDGSRTNAGASRNILRGNFIGTNVAGTAVSADYSFSVAGNLNGGVLISAGGFKPDGTAGTANDNVIGGTSPSARNVISGNGSFGINLSNGIATATATRNLIQGNYIGTNAAGAAALGNGSGVFLNTNGNTVGGTFAGARNVISGNNYNSLTSSGIAACCGANDNLIQGNYIGTDATGTFAVPNAVHGIILNNNANNNTVGGTTPEARNIISGNVVVGVAIGNSGNKVQGNYIGTDVTGTQALGNGYSGVHVEQAANALIGGTEPGAGNVISANGLGGVYIASNNTIVQGNFIGTKADGASALGNLNFGVSVGGDGNLIGGRASGAGNRIAFSIIERTIDYGSGVVVTSGSATVVGNSIYSNEGLGIDVGRDWLTANDPCDGDGAANGLQNYPVLSSASSGGGATTVQGTLDSNPSTVYTLDFYANDSCAAYGFGEGRTYLGSANVTTGAACGGSFTATLPFVVPAGQILTATATDPAGNTSEFSACRVVTASNRPPDAVDDAAATNEDTPVSVGVLANDTDPDGDALTISSFTQGLNGTVTSGGGGALVYTPNANFNGSDSFTYRITDGNGGTDTATVTVTVNPVNDPPDAVDDAASTNEDTAVNINVRANDTGGDCSAVNVTSVTQGAHGSVIINPDGTLRYTPNANFNGADSFTYSIGCAAAGSDTANVSVTVNASNDAPVANNESYAVNEDSGLSVNAAAGVLANDTDAEGDALTAVLVSGPSHGSLTLNADGSFNYTPAADFYGADSFTYQAHDGVVGSNIAVVTINVGAVNDAPDARDDAATTPEDVAVNVNVLGNDTDADGDALSVEGVTQAVHGAVSINADGTVKYAPNANYNGADAFTYTVNDGHGRTDTATVAVTVTPVNDAPVAVGDSYSTNEDASLNVPVPGVLGNDSDPEGNTLAALLVSGPSHGSLGWNANGSFSYTPASNYNGGDSFTYRASDGSLSSNVATVNISINPVNDPPSAVNDSYSTNQGTTLNVAAPGVLGNDADTDGVALSAVLVNGTANGALTLNADGSFSYTPAANFAGTDSFTYQASDGAALSNTATVSITVVAVAPRWLMTGSLNTGRAGHTATLLLNGKVLVAGGSSSSGTLFNSAELYDPATGTWTLTGNIIEGRINHTATLLPDGRVLVVGGDTNAGRSAHAELYNPATGQWSSTGSLNTGRINHTATLLSNGKVLVAGGFGFSGLVTRAELYDPATGTWSNTGNLNAGRFAHTAVLLRDGSVLVAGGTDNNNILDSAELYNPATGTWSVTGSLSVRRDATEAVLLPNGKVLIAGGNSQSTFGLFVTNTAELYDPATGRWTRTGDLITRRLSHTTTRLR